MATRIRDPAEIEELRLVEDYINTKKLPAKDTIVLDYGEDDEFDMTWVLPGGRKIFFQIFW